MIRRVIQIDEEKCNAGSFILMKKNVMAVEYA